MSVSQRLNRWLRGGLPTWYDPAYRPPSVSVESGLGYEPRRADYVAWYLADVGAVTREDLRYPPRATWAQLARVHSDRYLDSLSDPATLARVFQVPTWDTPVEEVLLSMRLAVGGTISATREALRRQGPTLNLLGGFHHARPDRGGPLSLLNDVAVAIAEARAMGLEERVVVLDLDAHSPTGLPACLAGRRGVRVLSLDEPGWPEHPCIDAEHVPEGCDDATYLRALHRLLERTPSCALAFVIAGGDVLAGDRQAKLALTEAGARRRDLIVASALSGVASVWLPGGGFHRDAWRVLAGTALALALGSDEPIPADAQPLRRRFDTIFRSLDPVDLGDDPDDLGAAIRLGGPTEPRWMGYYPAAALEKAFNEYGIIDHLRRLGYSAFEVRVETGREDGDLLELSGHADGEAHVLIECVASRERLGEEWMLYINWLSLRHPKAHFHPSRPKLPGQREPGLGLAPEITEMLGLVARRLGLAGVWFRPAHYHVAYSGRRLWRFTEAARQGRFEAMLRDLGGHPLLEVTRAADEGRLLANGEPYTWEADGMVYRDERSQPSEAWWAEVARVREGWRFSLPPDADHEE